MRMIREFMMFLSQQAAPHLDAICLAIIACMLVLYGEDLNRWIARQIKSDNKFLRFIVFVLVCAFGYGALSVAASRVLVELFKQIDRMYWGVVIILIFLGIGSLAQRKRHI